MKTFVLRFLALSLFAAATLVQQAQAQNEIESYTKVGQAMPSVAVTDLDGANFKTDQLKGKVILVNFWATWCPPCLEEMPRLEKEVWQNFKSSDFAMVAIAREQSEQEISAFRKKYNYTFPMASDLNRTVYKLFGSGGIPRSYVIGTDGKILFQTVGYNPAEFNEMKEIIAKELKNIQKEKPAK